MLAEIKQERGDVLAMPPLADRAGAGGQSIASPSNVTATRYGLDACPWQRPLIVFPWMSKSDHIACAGTPSLCEYSSRRPGGGFRFGEPCEFDHDGPPRGVAGCRGSIIAGAAAPPRHRTRRRVEGTMSPPDFDAVLTATWPTKDIRRRADALWLSSPTYSRTITAGPPSATGRSNSRGRN